MPPSRPVPLVWAEPAPASPRGLSRERIVRAAIEVADEGGERALTMAAVAGRLGSYTAMALYRHVPGKEALIDLMVDEVTGEVALPTAPGEDWRAQLRAIALSTWDMSMRHPWYARVVHSSPPLGPNMLRRTECMLEILTVQGVSARDAVTYAALLDRDVFGGALQAAAEEDLARRYGLGGDRELAAAVSAARERVAASGRYPILSGWMASPTVTTAEQQ
ncbi:MAG TPA: TetR/AcrR family transcriptional regulator, partial [Solirubrobacteraceae bacterium]|nr:TetR/AcrR family transcriptional regulator [Solirubrobacteraceae bacterium]